MSLRKGIGFCQQSEAIIGLPFFDLSNGILYTKNDVYKGLNYEYR